MPSLKEFAKAHPQKSRVCTVCSNPKQKEIDLGLREGLTATTISRWLQEEGFDVTVRQVSYHIEVHIKRSRERAS